MKTSRSAIIDGSHYQSAVLAETFDSLLVKRLLIGEPGQQRTAWRVQREPGRGATVPCDRGLTPVPGTWEPWQRLFL